VSSNARMKIRRVLAPEGGWSMNWLLVKQTSVRQSGLREPTRTNIRHAALKSRRKSRLSARRRYHVTGHRRRASFLPCLVFATTTVWTMLLSPPAAVAVLTMRFRFEILSVNHGTETASHRVERRVRRRCRRPNGREREARGGPDRGHRQATE
jgi:hypothetical protein